MEMGVQAVETLHEVDEEDYAGIMMKSVSIQMTVQDQEVEEVECDDYAVQITVEKN
jgi:hypothetical protein